MTALKHNTHYSHTIRQIKRTSGRKHATNGLSTKPNKRRKRNIPAQPKKKPAASPGDIMSDDNKKSTVGKNFVRRSKRTPNPIVRYNPSHKTKKTTDHPVPNQRTTHRRKKTKKTPTNNNPENPRRPEKEKNKHIANPSQREEHNQRRNKTTNDPTPTPTRSRNRQHGGGYGAVWRQSMVP